VLWCADHDIQPQDKRQAILSLTPGYPGLFLKLNLVEILYTAVWYQNADYSHNEWCNTLNQLFHTHGNDQNVPMPIENSLEPQW